MYAYVAPVLNAFPGWIEGEGDGETRGLAYHLKKIYQYRGCAASNRSCAWACIQHSLLSREKIGIVGDNVGLVRESQGIDR